MRKVGIAAALLGVLGLGAFYFLSRNAEEEPRSEEAAGAKVGQGRSDGIWLTNGVYGVDAEASVEGARGVAFQLGLLGKLEVQALGQQGEVWVERWAFSGQVTSATLEEDAVAALDEALERPFFVESVNGLVTGLRFVGDTLRPAQTTWRSFVTLTQFQPSGEPLWQLAEEDAAGSYLAQYERKGDETKKTKLRYTSIRTPGVSLRLLSSQQIFTVSGAKRTLSASEEIETNSQVLPVPLRGLVQLDLDYREAAEPVEKQWFSDYAAAEGLSLAAAGTETSVAGELDHAKAKGFSWETAAAALHGAAGDKGYTRAYQALTAMIRLDPSALEKTVTAAEADGPLRTAMLAALGDAGTAPAQTALRKLLNGRGFSDEHRLIMARGLSRSAAPTKETVEFLKASVKDPVLGQQARLGLGSNVARLRQSNPELARETLGTIEQSLKSSTGAEKGDYLGALGNTRDPASLPILRPYLTDAQPAVAARATFALRHLPGATVDILLAEQLGPSKPVEVRENALQALRDREPRSPLIEQVSTLMLNEPEERVRGAAVEIGAFWADRSTLLRETLVRVAAQDSSGNLKKIAVAALERLNSPQ